MEMVVHTCIGLHYNSQTPILNYMPLNINQALPTGNQVVKSWAHSNLSSSKWAPTTPPPKIMGKILTKVCRRRRARGTWKAPTTIIYEMIK